MNYYLSCGCGEGVRISLAGTGQPWFKTIHSYGTDLGVLSRNMKEGRGGENENLSVTTQKQIKRLASFAYFHFDIRHPCKEAKYRKI